jgi:hypothetical protein
MPVMGGKWYFEIDGDPASTFAIGMEGFRANYANGYFTNTSYSSAGWSFTGKTGGYAGAEFVVTRSNQTFSANANSSTLGIAYDGDTGQFSIRANGAWVDNADPTSTFFAAFVDCKSIGEIYFLAYANGGTTIRTTPRYEVPEGFIFTDGTVNYIYGKTEDGKLLGRGGNFVAGSDVNQPIKQGYGKIQYQDGHECYLYDSNDEWITKENFYDDPMAAKPKEDTVVNISKLWMALDVSGSDVVCRGFLPNDPGYVPVPYKDFTLKFPALFDNGVAPDVLLSSDSSLAVNVQALNKYGGNDVWSNNYLPALEGPAGSMNSIRIDRDRVNEEEEGIDQFMWLKSTEYDQVDNPVVGNGTTVFWFKPTLAGRHYYQGNGFIDTTEDQNDKWLLFYTTNTQYPYYIGNYKTPGANYTASGYFGDYYWFQNNPDIGQFTFPKSTFYELIDNRIAPRPMEAVLSAAESIYWTDKSLALNWKNRTSNGDFIGNDASKNNNNFYTNNFIFTNSLSSYTDKWTPTALSFSAYDGDPTTFSSFRQTMLNPSQGVDTRLAVQNEPSPGGISVNQIRVLMGGTGQTYCEFRFYGNYDGSPGSEAQLIGTAVYDNTGLEQGVLAPAWEEIDCPGAFLTRQELYIDNRNVQEEEAEVSGNIYQIQLDGNTLVQTNVSTDACLDSPYMNIATIPSDEVATVKDCGLTITSGTHNPFYTGDGSSTYYYERDFRKVYAVGKVENLGAGQYNFGQQPWIDGGPGQAGPDDESIVLGTPWAADAGVAYAAYDISDPDHVKEIEATEAKYADYFQQKDARKQRLGAIVGKMKRELTKEEFALLEDNLAPYSVRARNADGTYRGDDPSTPDVDEAWENG